MCYNRNSFNWSMKDTRCVCYNRNSFNWSVRDRDNSSMSNSNWSRICRSSLDYLSSISRCIRVDSCPLLPVQCKADQLISVCLK